MVNFEEHIYQEKYSNFKREYKRIQVYKTSRPLTSDLNLRKEYRENLIEAYNNIFLYVTPFISDLQLEAKLEIRSRIQKLLEKLKDCFEILKLQYNFESNILTTIDINKIIEIQEIETQENNRKETMAPQTASDFIRVASQMISDRYHGDPMDLDSFIDAVELLKTLCEEQNENTFLAFVKTRLGGKARQLINSNPANVNEIIEKLRDGIKIKPSKTIEGKFLALRLDKTSITKFTEQAEKYADQYNHSLCNEGYSKEKANELTIAKTIEMCRKSNIGSSVRSVLVSSKFSEPSEVIAKMIIEMNDSKSDPQDSYPRKNNNNHNKQYNNSNSGNNNKRSNNNYNNNRSSNRNNYNNGRQNNNQPQNRQNRYNNYNNSNNYRGNQSSYTQNNNNSQPIRQFSSGNEMNPGNSGLSLNQQNQ